MTEGGDRPTVTGMKAGVGVEFVKLTNPLKLSGKVELYLQDMIVLSRLSVDRYLGIIPTSWALVLPLLFGMTVLKGNYPGS